tara:strand:+ start:486 stop:854 length:369 start_codon:yes stop_codon:yes gene_type:complete
MKDHEIMHDLFMKGIDSFNRHSFYDAHEFWEDLWSDYRLSDAKFIQALIQLAVGYFHITNNNKNGALGLLNKCKPKFEMYKPLQRNINVDYILSQVDKSIDNINNINEMSDFDWELVPEIKN